MKNAKVATVELPQVYQLKITLRNTRPPIWRRLLVPANIKLNKLHDVLQTTFGWFNSHLHQFESREELYGVPDPELAMGGLKVVNERTVTLARAVETGGPRLNYTYDFGDGWDHTIVLEKTLDPDPVLRYPVCLAGKGKCPPEDCGGIPGFYNFLEIMADPAHPEHDELLNWAGGPFDPDEFSPEVVNYALHPPRGRLRP
jgi:Plasmid pRiA4b ORF-3-like protein